MKKKLICAMLVTAFVLSAAACGESAKTAETTGTAASVTDETTEAAPAYTLPESKDYGGRSFTVLAADGRSEYYEAEQDGEVINDAVYSRKLDTEDRLGIKIEYVYRDSGWKNESDYVNAMTSTILAGDSTYDLMTGPVIFLCKIMTDGYFINTDDLDIDLSNPWWVSGMKDRIGISDQLYLLVGDFATTLYSAINVAYFNQKLVSEFSLSDPYETVRSGKWTLDAMLDMMKNITTDLNGDSAIDLNNDRIALVTQDNPLRSIQTSTGTNIFSKNGDEIMYLGLTERLTEVCEKLSPAFADKDIIMTDGTYEENAEIFAADRALFMFSALRITSELRNMESDYGILPFPKFNEEDEYQMDVPISTVLWVVPATASDLQLTSDFCEYYSYLSYQSVVPAYFETTLKEKYSRDANTTDMLDIIRDSTSLTFDSSYGSCFNTNPFTVVETILRGKSQAASYIASNEESWKSTLSDLIANFDK